MDRKRPPDPLKERISSLGDMPAGQAIPHKPAPPPTSPPRLGFGKLVVPAKKPQPLPLAVKSSPEATKVGGFEPAPGETPKPPGVRTFKEWPPRVPASRPPPKRSFSPPPPELAGDEQSARSERQRVRERVAEVERRESIRPAPAPVLDSIKIELPANLKGGIGALGKAILGAIAAALVGGGGAMVGSKATTDALPAPMAIPCQQRCPLGNKQPIPPGLAPSELQATMLCCEVMTSRNESEAAVAEAVKAREIAGAASDIAKRTAAELEKRAPKVNP